MLKRESKFPAVADMLNKWFTDMLQEVPNAVLVSHNTATDIQFLFCEYQRCGMKLPSQFKHGLDTLKTLSRFSSVCYRKVPVEEWPAPPTKTGKNSMGVKPCAVYCLRKRDSPATFEEVCGDHHNALADTKAVAVILFDEEQFGAKSLHACIFKSNRKCFQPLEEIWTAMQVKMQESVIEIESLPDGWVEAQVHRSSHAAHAFNNAG